jgi:uncharacterized OB-fold protein
VFFPMQHHGCERCGSTALEPHLLAGSGHVLAFTRVHRHPDPSRPTPFAVVSVMTEDGVTLNALADPATEHGLATSARVVTRLVPETRAGHGPYDLRFAVAESGAGSS